MAPEVTSRIRIALRHLSKPLGYSIISICDTFSVYRVVLPSAIAPTADTIDVNSAVNMSVEVNVPVYIDIYIMMAPPETSPSITPWDSYGYA
jgi:hypothetical protein